MDVTKAGAERVPFAEPRSAVSLGREAEVATGAW
jgi:hypothetical protein